MVDWVLAIDFGTSATVVASRDGDRPPEVIEVDGERRTPSVVLVTDDGRVVVGRPAEEMAAARPTRAVRAVKLRLGDPAPIVLAGRPHPAASLAAEVLAKVYDEALRHHGSPPERVRLTHPAAWGAPRRQQLLRAAELAGLPEPELVAEPVAAAIAYTDLTRLEPDRYVAVFDLGGGTLDLAVLRTTELGFEVVGHPGGDPQLGGELFDELLAEHLGSRLEPEVWEQLQSSDEEPWRQASAAVRREARRAKELLSTQASAEVLLPLPSGLRAVRIESAELTELTGPYLDEGARLLARLVQSAGLSPGELDAVYLAGGASRMHGITEAISRELPGVIISRRGDPKSAVALGATHPLAVLPIGTRSVGATEDAPPASTVDREAGTVVEGRSSTGQPAAGEPDTAGPAPVGRLVVTAGPAAGTRFALAAGTAVLGRDPAVELAVDDPALSRRHAVVTVVGDAVWIDDAGSRNGTAVDGRPVAAPVRLVPGAVVEVGTTLLRFEPPDASTAGGAPVTVRIEERPLVVPAAPELRAGASAAEEAAYRSAVHAVAAEVAAAARIEATRRDRLVPGVADLLQRAEDLGPQAAVERPGTPGFLRVRVGWCEQLADVAVAMTPGGDAGLRAWADAELRAARRIDSAPVVIDLGAAGHLALTGDAALVQSGARWLLTQLVARHSPDDVGLRLDLSDNGGTWSWLEPLTRTDATPSRRSHTVVLTDHDVAPAAGRTVVHLGADPAADVQLHYEPLPARVTVSGPRTATIDTAMADQLRVELARTIVALVSTPGRS